MKSKEQKIRELKLCPHGQPPHFYCGLCAAEKAPKCKHGNPFYCGLCWKETGNGIVQKEES